MSQQITGTTGTPTISNVQPVDNGGSIVSGVQSHYDPYPTTTPVQGEAYGLGDGNTNLNAQDGIQGDKNGFQELMSFVSKWAANNSMTGLAALHDIRARINAALLDTAIRRTYLP